MNSGVRSLTAGTHPYRWSDCEPTGTVTRLSAVLSKTTPRPAGAMTGCCEVPLPVPVWVLFHDTSVTIGPAGAGTRESHTNTSGALLVSVTFPTCSGSVTSWSAGTGETNAMTLPSELIDSCSAPKEVGRAGPDVPSARVDTMVSEPCDSGVAAAACPLRTVTRIVHTASNMEATTNTRTPPLTIRSARFPAAAPRCSRDFTVLAFESHVGRDSAVKCVS